MSKKYSKWLVGAALLGAAAGAGLAYFKKHKKEKENWEDDFEDFEDDFLDDDLEDFDGEDAADAREYVTIPSSSVPEEAAENAADTAEAIFEKEAEEETVKAEAEEPKETAEAVPEHRARILRQHHCRRAGVPCKAGVRHRSRCTGARRYHP